MPAPTWHARRVAAPEDRYRLNPEVVRRSFGSETVVLNVETGAYHGVDLVGTRILDGIEAGLTVRQVTADVAEAYAQAPEQVQADVVAFCAALEARGIASRVADGEA